MKTYLVGGAVRDTLMGIRPHDRDYVVTGATWDDLLSQGFLPVGESFPVFLHPETNDEYALARKERKIGPGYMGFAVGFDPSVTLEEDLARRDLTINSIALDVSTDELVDPYNGIQDLKDKVLRHTSPAFIEDPLRVVRLARFYARFMGFKIAQETLHLAKTLIASGSLDELSPERHWREIDKVSNEAADPSVFFELLYELGAFSKAVFFRQTFGESPDTRLLGRIAHRSTLDFIPASFSLPALASPDMAALDPSVQPKVYDLRRLVSMAMDLDPSPETSLEILSLSRAWSQGTLFQTLCLLVDIAKDCGLHVRTTGDDLRAAHTASAPATSESFRHLSGPEIGKAIRAARLELIKELHGSAKE